MPRFPSGIMTTCCVPWDKEGQFAESLFRRSVRTKLKIGTKLLYLFGTAGEGYAVTEIQFDHIVQAFADEMRQGNAEPMIGIISLSLGTICDRIRRCCEQGIMQYQISLPSWGALSDRELFAFFEAVCGQFPQCQFMHYNLPRAKRIVTAEEYCRLADSFSNLVATKNTGDSLSQIRSLMTKAPQLQHFFSESGYAYGSTFGECGILASFVMNWPKLYALYRAGQQHDAATKMAILKEVDVVLESLFSAVSAGRIDGSYDKLYEKMYDPDFPLRLLPPYIGSTDAEFQTFVQTLKERLPDWIPQVEK